MKCSAAGLSPGFNMKPVIENMGFQLLTPIPDTFRLCSRSNPHGILQQFPNGDVCVCSLITPTRTKPLKFNQTVSEKHHDDHDNWIYCSRLYVEMFRIIFCALITITWLLNNSSDDNSDVAHNSYHSFCYYFDRSLSASQGRNVSPGCSESL